MIETLIPSFIPDTSKARKVSFKKAEDIRDDSLVKQNREEEKRRFQQLKNYKIKLNRWRKEKVKAEKRVTRCEWFLNEAQKALKGVEDEKPLPPVFGNSGLTELESLHVESETEVLTSPQSNL